MDLRDVLRATRRHWWLVAVALVAALGLAGVTTALTAPQYATSVMFFVTTPSEGAHASYQGGMFSKQRVLSYEHLLRGELARKVAERDGISLATEQVETKVASNALPDTVLLEATVTDSDKDRSERFARALTTEFVALVDKLETPPGQEAPQVKVEVVEGPTLNPDPVSPQPVRNLALAALLGLLIGVVAALVRQMLDLTVKTADALRHLTGAPVLAVVPYDPGLKKHTPLVAGNRAAESAAKRTRSHSARGEAFRHLRTNLQFVNPDHQAKVIVITSAVLDEGKSTSAVNLAITCAQAGRRVALVEADLRRPRVADYLGLDGRVGLSNVLAGQADANDVLQRWGRDELYVLPSGYAPPNPSELLGSHTTATLLQRLRETFDVVIVDTPPVVPFTDAAVVAAVADGAVLVVRSGKTHQARIRAAVASLVAVDARVLGCVLNMQNAESDDYYYYGYWYHDGERPHTGDVPSSGAPRPNGSMSTLDSMLGAER